MRNAVGHRESAAETGTLEGVFEALEGQLRGIERLGVAFSGGVDSSLLLALTARVLGPERVVALLGVSPSLAADERIAALAVAAEIGVRLVEVETREGDRAEYVANGADRCFFCKDELFATIDAGVAGALGLDAIAYGENRDDVDRPDRPGARAATDHAVLRPLAVLGLRKREVRALAAELGLSVSDKPASPCLASRIPHGKVVTPEKLRQIDQAESALRALGFADLRVRHHDEVARVELAAEDLVRAVTEPLRSQVLAAVRTAGFRFVAVDLAGIQSGGFTLPLLQLSAPGPLPVEAQPLATRPSTSSGNGPRAEPVEAPRLGTRAEPVEAPRLATRVEPVEAPRANPSTSSGNGPRAEPVEAQPGRARAARG